MKIKNICHVALDARTIDKLTTNGNIMVQTKTL